jgi:hypothetical protein
VLLTQSEVLEWVGGSDKLPANWAARLAMAEGYVAGYIGATTLEQVTPITETERWRSYRLDLPVKAGPITAVTSLTINGDAVDAADFTVDFWEVIVPAGIPTTYQMADPIEWPDWTDPNIDLNYSETVLVFTAGWADVAALPEQVRLAVLTAFNKLGSGTGDEIASEGIGDFRVAYRAAKDRGLDSDLKVLLAPYVRPQKSV